MAPKKIPKKLYRYFWDVNVEKLNPQKKPYFIISRLLDKGDDQAVRWVRRNYSKTQIKDTFKKMRGFNVKVANFWSLFLKIPKKEVLCLQTFYQKMRKRHWPY